MVNNSRTEVKFKQNFTSKVMLTLPKDIFPENFMKIDRELIHPFKNVVIHDLFKQTSAFHDLFKQTN